MRPKLGFTTALSCTLVLASCRAPTQRPVPLPAGPQVVEVDMADYRFDYDPAIAAGPVLFRVTNTGTVPHSLTMLPLDDDFPPIDQQLRGSERRSLTPFAGVGARKPGASTSFAVHLEAGVRYAFVCFVTDDQGKAHALRGMSSEFRALIATTTSSPGLSRSSPGLSR